MVDEKRMQDKKNLKKPILEKEITTATQGHFFFRIMS
jgi:hypothetical protein